LRPAPLRLTAVRASHRRNARSWRRRSAMPRTRCRRSA
jgi:hypothetical protein